jgi:hypothetical protein
MNPMLRKVLGEADKEGLFPDDAQELDKSQDIVGKPLNPIVKVVQEPSRPSGDKERYLTPYSALTAPDCTPDALQPIDPSRVPGGTGPERFTAADLEQEAPQTGLGQEHPSLKAMDVLLGRKRMGGPARTAADFAQSGAVQTEESAQVLNEAHVRAKQFAASAVVPATDGGAMPEPTPPGDGHQVLSAFRRFVQ